ncbi:hypothetical protein [uncultured Tateyamaria sp.]|uniref:hypothetical protein n=1 Tax=uncultured Tateyamaria sp. TaxID=455651 RepID=UPI00262C63CE|nr:hypothetical protein [uncultured Tateyamaria sp.]
MTNTSASASVAQTVTDAGQRAAADLNDAVDTQVSKATTEAAQRVDTVAQATEAARDELPADSAVDPMLGQAVDVLGQVAEHLRGADLNALAHEAGDLAKRHPVLALGGAALVGFAAARFLKAGSGPDRAALAGDPWATNEGRS